MGGYLITGLAVSGESDHRDGHVRSRFRPASAREEESGARRISGSVRCAKGGKGCRSKVRSGFARPRLVKGGKGRVSGSARCAKGGKGRQGHEGLGGAMAAPHDRPG